MSCCCSSYFPFKKRYDGSLFGFPSLFNKSHSQVLPVDEQNQPHQEPHHCHGKRNSIHPNSLRTVVNYEETRRKLIESIRIEDADSIIKRNPSIVPTEKAGLVVQHLGSLKEKLKDNSLADLNIDSKDDFDGSQLGEMSCLMENLLLSYLSLVSQDNHRIQNLLEQLNANESDHTQLDEIERTQILKEIREEFNALVLKSYYRDDI